MTVEIVLTDLSTGEVDKANAVDIDDKRCFQYTDNAGNLCEICIYEEGLCLFKQTDDYLLELHLRCNYYAKITSQEGEIKLDAKVVDFLEKDDILVMRYVIDDIEREIKIIYRS